MIHLLTAGPGSGKSLYATNILLNLSRDNLKNLKFNFYLAKSFFEKIDNLKLQDRLRSVILETGQGLEKTEELIFLEENYFDFLKEEYFISVISNPETDDLQKNFPDYYFQRVSILNEIVKALNKELNLGLPAFKPVRTIYTNLDNLKLVQCRPLPPNCDWKATPQGSYYVIDEAQLIPIFSEEARGIDPIVKDLTIHRKLGYDFLFITQDPTFIHKYIRKLATLHIHLINIFGWEQSMKMEWPVAQDSPNAVKTIARAENISRWIFPKHVYNLYHSTTINTRKKRYPKKMIFFVVMAALVLLGGVTVYSNTNRSPIVAALTGEEAEKIEEQKNESSKQQPKNSNVQSDPAGAGLPSNTSGSSDSTQVQNSNGLFNNSDVSNSDLVATVPVQSPQLYDPSKPFDYIPDVSPPVVNHRVFSGCVSYQGKTFAVDQQGTKINGFNSKDCSKILKNSYDRPFDYFGNRKPPVQAMQQEKSEFDSKPNLTERVSTSEPDNQNSETSSL